MERYITDGTREGDSKLIEEVFKKYPKSVIINGNDHWYVEKHFNPNYFVRLFGFIKHIIAEISTIKDQKRTGVVVPKQLLPQIKEKYQKRFNKHLEFTVQVLNAESAAVSKIYK